MQMQQTGNAISCDETFISLGSKAQVFGYTENNKQSHCVQHSKTNIKKNNNNNNERMQKCVNKK